MDADKEVGVVAIDYISSLLKGDEDIRRTRENDLDIGIGGAYLGGETQGNVKVEVFLFEFEIVTDGTVVLSAVSGINDDGKGGGGKR